MVLACGTTGGARPEIGVGELVLGEIATGSGVVSLIEVPVEDCASDARGGDIGQRGKRTRRTEDLVRMGNGIWWC